MYVEEHVFWFDVAVGDAEAVHVLEPADDLREVVVRLAFAPAAWVRAYTRPSMM